ncbi:MAG: HAMP domain-containing sensor histidine kinase [Candidatus Eisenbacteria bacterium]
MIALIGGGAGGPNFGPELRALLPLLTAVFHAERRVHSAHGEARNALDAATRAGALADALDGARRNLAAVNVALQIEVGERRHAEAALADADRRKDEFLATLAHELRNPLAPIRNGIQVLRMERPLDPLAPGIVDMMERQVEQLVRLVDDLMDVARITRGKLELRCEQVELRTVIERAIETSRPAIAARGHTLDVAIPGRPILLSADPIRLAQALANLLQNAAKYTEPGGRIDLAVTRNGSDIEIRIRDSGIGIPADMLSRIFDMFTQVDSSLDRSHGGLGIGLMLVRRLIEMHGGRVTAHSDGASRGSTFIVCLPMLSDAAVRRAETSPASPAGAGEFGD